MNIIKSNNKPAGNYVTGNDSQPSDCSMTYRVTEKMNDEGIVTERTKELKLGHATNGDKQQLKRGMGKRLLGALKVVLFLSSVAGSVWKILSDV